MKIQYNKYFEHKIMMISNKICFGNFIQCHFPEKISAKTDCDRVVNSFLFDAKYFGILSPQKAWIV